MCGIFGIVSDIGVNFKHLETLAASSRQRGVDSSGIVYLSENAYTIKRADYDILKLLRRYDWKKSSVVMGHSRLITNGVHDNQPVCRDGMFVIHNGIIINEAEIWNDLQVERRFQIDSEAILALAIEHINSSAEVDEVGSYILTKCKGTVSAVLALPNIGKAILFSNNGSLYWGTIDHDIYFASESYPLSSIGCKSIKQIMNSSLTVNIPKSERVDVVDDQKRRERNIIPSFVSVSHEESMLQYHQPNVKRCTKCILPETMPFIKFDSQGVCNYCNNYKLLNVAKPKEDLFKLVEPYRQMDQPDCIVPFSGGRDSSYGLHLIVNELKMKPIAYTYDWGMVTDLGRRNISRMCAELGVENIIVAADISKKRDNIAKNLKAWLKAPNLGMISILTAGDKHFFRYVDMVKRQTGIKLNLWGINPLEVTHFKSGFLGMKPHFEEKQVYMQGMRNQLKYQSLRFKAMLQSPGYFNSSLWDTLSGEYYRSFNKKEDYYHIFDYWTWDEKTIDDTLRCYNWETAPDTNVTWRIGDGTAAFYNYVYYTVAGFTEHDTFRSNQIREGQISREEALVLVADENKPRYQNIRWYLDTLNMDFRSVISVVNNIPKLYTYD